MQFTDYAGLQGFPFLNLTAWKLPHAGQVFALRALADQHPAVGVDQGGGGHEHGLHRRAKSFGGEAETAANIARRSLRKAPRLDFQGFTDDVSGALRLPEPDWRSSRVGSASL